VSASIFDAAQKQERHDFTGGDVAFAPNSEENMNENVGGASLDKDGEKGAADCGVTPFGGCIT
jgi:hypothetical protein